MSDKMKIVGLDGSDKYLLEDNKITDLKKHTCLDNVIKVKDGEHLVCRICGKRFEEPIQEEIINGS